MKTPGSAGRLQNLAAADVRRRKRSEMARTNVRSGKWMRSLPKDQPFYMNYWMFSVHAPFDAKAALIEKYRGKIDPKNPQHSPTYAAMVESMDDAVGTLLDAVDQASLADRTIFIFTADNGGNMYNGIREKDREGNEFVVEPTSNRPLRGGKATVYEGGIRVPTVIAWPKVTQPGSRSDEIIQSTDFYPTLLTGLGIGLPKDWSVDGVDITTALRGGKLSPRGIFTFFPHSPPVPDWLPPAMCVHSGDWKLIRLFHQGVNGAHDYRLYNLKADLGEAHDLAKAQPAKVRELDRLIQDHIEQSKAVVPQPNPALDAEMHGCLIYGIGSIGPDRYHGPGIYTQNETGTKKLTDNILFGNYSTAIQAYGSSRAEVSGFHIEGNIAFAPIKEGDRQRILIGGGRPSRRITASDNILYEVPLQLGYNAPYSEDAVVTGNWIVNAGLAINGFTNVVQEKNTVIPPEGQRPQRPADVILRPSRYTPSRGNLAIFNWARRPQVEVDLSHLLKPGQPFRIVCALDFYGKPVAAGTFDGKPISVPIPVGARTGQGEFCAFVVLAVESEQ